MKKLTFGKAAVLVGVAANASILIFLPQSRAVIAAQGYYGDYERVPTCILKSDPKSIVIAEGGSGVLTTDCMPKSDGYKWSGDYLSFSQSGGLVYPFKTSSYSVVAQNRIGDGNLAKASIYVCGSVVANAKNTWHPRLETSELLSQEKNYSKLNHTISASILFAGKKINSIAYDCNNISFNLIKTNVGWRLLSRIEGIDDITGLDGIFQPNVLNEFDVSKNSGKVYRVYQAAFNREPDEGGLRFWISSMNDHGMSLQGVAKGFIDSPEFRVLYGSSPSNEQFITKLYANVLHRLPDQNGYKYWLSLLKTGSIDKVDALVHFSESLENKVNVINGIMQTIDQEN